MRRGRSTGTPTAEEAAYIVACKEGPCIACIQRFGEGKSWIVYGCDFHHMKSGNVRRGHKFGVGLCTWHHRKIPFGDFSIEAARKHWGPSLMDGSRLFHDTYGSDDTLLAIQSRILAGD